jgi:hypothetical protein
MRSHAGFWRADRIRAVSAAIVRPLTRRRVAAIAIGAVALLLIALLFMPNVPTVFSVVAHSEYVEGTISPADSEILATTWRFDDVLLCTAAASPCAAGVGNADAPVGVVPNFRGRITLLGGVEFQARRISGGSLRLELSGPADRMRIESDNGASQNVDPPIAIVIQDPEQRVRDGASIVLPFRASRVVVGGEQSSRTPAPQRLLRAAQVSMLGTSLLGGRLIRAGEVALDEGDQFRVESVEPQAGIITTDERPLLNVIYRAKGSRALIRKYELQDILVSASPFERLKNDPALAGLASIFLGLITIYAAIKQG